MSDARAILEAAEIERGLAELPGWTLAGDGLHRRYETHGWKGSLLVVSAIGHLAEAAWHHPDLSVSYGWVEVRLMSHDVGGVTARDLALAAKIEAVIGWRPGLEPGPLSGTPDDPRFAYIKHEG